MASSTANPRSQTLKTSFKTPEGRYKLQHEKKHAGGLAHYSHHAKIMFQGSLGDVKRRMMARICDNAEMEGFQVTLANLKERPISQPPVATASESRGGLRLAARIFGTGAGRVFSFIGGSGGNKVVSGNGKMGVGSSDRGSSTPSPSAGNYDGSGTYLIFNIGDALVVSDYNSHQKDSIKTILFSNSNPTCHAFDMEAKDRHDLVIGLNSGDVYSVSLRQQLQEAGKKIVGAHHYNKEGVINKSRCTSVAWVPHSDGAFVVAHADGNLHQYEKRFSKAGWHICDSPISSISCSPDGAYLAIVARDGYLRIFDFKKEELICGGKGYCGALLCCAWSPDGKYIVVGGEDDLVQVWSMDARKIVAWCEGHNSWVSGVAFDPYWSAPFEVDTRENIMYRFGSAGQDAQLLLWDLVMDELVVPLRHPPGGSPTLSSRSISVHGTNASPFDALQLAPSMRDVPKISPLVSHRSHIGPLSGLVFTSESLLTICRDGNIKIWTRPGVADDSVEPSTSDIAPSDALSKEEPQLPPVKRSDSFFKSSHIRVA